MAKPHVITGHLVASDIDRAQDASRRLRYALVEQLAGDALTDLAAWTRTAATLLHTLDHDLDPALVNIRDVNEGRSKP